MTVLLSTKGQLVIPKEIRDKHGWGPGTELMLVDEEDRLVLREVPDVPVTTLTDILGCARYEGPAKTLEEMDEAIERGVRESW